MPISVVFDPPLPSDSPSTFNTKAFTLLGDLNDWSTQANALPGEVATNLSALLAAPPAIGGTTPAAGSFTTLSASGPIYGSTAGVRLPTASPVYFNVGFTSYIQEVSAGNIQIVAGGATSGTFSSSGLAVTGTLSASGNVLQGATTARTIGLAAQVQIEGTNNTAALSVTRNADSAGAGRVTLAKARGTANGSVTAVVSQDQLGLLTWYGADGTAMVEAASIRGDVDGTPGTNDMPGRLVFSTTADGASSPTERMRIDSAGSVGIGGASSGSEKLLFTGTLPASGGFTFGTRNSATFNPAVTTTAGYAFYTDHTVSTGTLPGLSLYHASQGTYTGTVTTQYGFHASSGLTGAGTNYGFFSNIAASGSTRYNFYANGTAPNRFVGETLVIGAAGLGYGTGAGGTVTQATSKSTAVTLNKPCGQITMHNAALGAGATVSFPVNNTACQPSDVIHAVVATGVTSYANYRLTVGATATTGVFNIALTNESGASLSEAVQIQFCIIKGATA